MNSPYKYVLCLLVGCLFFVGCISEDLNLPLYRIKSVTTNGATDISFEVATLSGTVSYADMDSVSCGIIYGMSPSLTDETSKMVANTPWNDYHLINTTGEVEFLYYMKLHDLVPNTTYYYRAYALDDLYTYGEVQSFTTPKKMPTVLITGYEAVDLGLSVKWATCNVGATSPEMSGDYFAWGETVTKSSYAESNSVTYGLSDSELMARGIIDANGNLKASYDAATVNWGENWRMPTEAEQEELRMECDWEWTTMNGVNGYKVKSRTNGNYIFVPTAGYRVNTSLIGAGPFGAYWSATPSSSSDGVYEFAYYLSFGLDYYGCGSYRYYGRAVRPVSDK